MNPENLSLELCDLRKAQREALLPRGAWADLCAMLRRTAGSHARLPRRLRLSAAGAGARKAARGFRTRPVAAVSPPGSGRAVSLRAGTPDCGAEFCAGEGGAQGPQPE